MSSEEEEVPLIVKCDHLTSLELGHWWEQSLEETAHCVSETRNESIQDKLRVVRCRTSVSLSVRYESGSGSR